MANSLVDLRGRSGVGAGFAWQLPPLLAAAVAWPVLLLVGPPHQQPSGRQRGVAAAGPRPGRRDR